MPIEQVRCQNCGGSDVRRLASDSYTCEHCHTKKKNVSDLFCILFFSLHCSLWCERLRLSKRIQRRRLPLGHLFGHQIMMIVDSAFQQEDEEYRRIGPCSQETP